MQKVVVWPTFTIFLINLARLQRKKWQKYVQITSNSTHLCETIMSHEFLLKWTDIWWFAILVAQYKMSHDTRHPYRPYYHNHNTFYVAQPCCTKSHNHVVPSRMTKFLSVWTHLYRVLKLNRRGVLVHPSPGSSSITGSRQCHRSCFCLRMYVGSGTLHGS